MTVSPYGLMIAAGILTAGAAGWFLTCRFALDFNDFLLLATYTVVFGVIGAKGAYLLLNAGRIDWSRLTDPAFFNALMMGGFIFYGGVPTGLFGLWLAGKLHKIEVKPYLRMGVPLLPLCHAFGRVGCYLAGCCFGIPYDGPLAVTYERSYGAPLGVPLFPVQLLEAVLVLAIAGTLFALCLRGWGEWSLLGLYMGLYGTARFCLEYLRYDAERGQLGWFSTSQWVSLVLVAVALAGVLWSRIKLKRA